MLEETERLSPDRFDRPRQVRIAPTLAGRVVALSAALFLGFDLFVLGRLGFGGCFLSSWCLVTGFFTWANLRGLEARAEFPREVSVASRFSFECALRGSRVVRDLLVCSGPEEERLAVVDAVFRLSPGQVIRRKLPARLERRGEVRSHSLLLKSTWPGLLFEARARFVLPIETLALPRTRRVRKLAWLRAAGVSQDPSSSGARRGEAEFRHLREYRVGDPVSRIHWKSSARQGRTLIRELDAERSKRVEFEFDTRMAHGETARGQALFETGVIAAAGLLASLLRSGAVVRFRLGGRLMGRDLSGTRDLRRALRLLALIESQAAGAPNEGAFPDGPGRLLLGFGSGSSSSLGSQAQVAPRSSGFDRTALGGLFIDLEQRGSRELFGGRRRAGDHPVPALAWEETTP